MNTTTLVEILKTVPEKKLRILELAGEILDASGEVQREVAQARIADLAPACAEAEAYANSTKEMVRQLRWLVQKRDR